MKKLMLTMVYIIAITSSVNAQDRYIYIEPKCKCAECYTDCMPKYPCSPRYIDGAPGWPHEPRCIECTPIRRDKKQTSLPNAEDGFINKQGF